MTVDRDATDHDATDSDATDHDATDHDATDSDATDSDATDSDATQDAAGARDLDCGHAPAVAYEVGFAIADDLDGSDDIDSACAMRATVHEVPLASEDADDVGCAVESCEHHHERVAEALRASAARHSGNVGAGASCRVDRDDR